MINISWENRKNFLTYGPRFSFYSITLQLQQSVIFIVWLLSQKIVMAVFIFIQDGGNKVICIFFCP